MHFLDVYDCNMNKSVIKRKACQKMKVAYLNENHKKVLTIHRYQARSQDLVLEWEVWMIC